MAFEDGLGNDGYDARLASLVAETTAVAAEMGALHARHTRALASVLDLAQARAAGESKAVQARELAIRDVSAELATALRVSDRAIQRQLDEAWRLVHQYPATHQSLAEGRISLGHARTVMDAGVGIECDDQRAAFEARALEHAELLTPARLKAAIAPIAEAARAASIDERHRIARAERRVTVRDLADGMAEVCAIVPTVLAHGIADRIAQMARAVKHAGAVEPNPSTPDAIDGETGDGTHAGTGVGDGRADSHARIAMLLGGADADADDRTLAQIGADAFCDLVLGAAPVASGEGLDAITAIVQVTVPVLTLAGQSDDGAELAGVGPVDAETARRLAGTAAGWDRVMTHPVNGTVLAVDRYRPSNDIRRTLRVRDEHCRFPGCRQAAHRCDIDHTHDAALGGETEIGNLAHLCRRHHSLKGHTRWKVENLSGGVLRWTSPLGVEYIDSPPRTVRFAEHPPGAVAPAPF